MCSIHRNINVSGNPVKPPAQEQAGLWNFELLVLASLSASLRPFIDLIAGDVLGTCLALPVSTKHAMACHAPAGGLWVFNAPVDSVIRGQAGELVPWSCSALVLLCQNGEMPLWSPQRARGGVAARMQTERA